MAGGPNQPKRARLGDRLLGIFGVRLVVFLLAARAFLPGVLEDPAFNVATYHDDHYYVMHDEAARRTIVDYHQVPAWNPWYCGGMIGLEFPTSSEAAPEFLFRVLFGTSPGRRLTVLFFVLFGMEGTFRYARKNGASAIGAATAAIAFSCMNHFVTLLRWGWVIMFNYNLIPWVALSFENGLRKRWWIVAGGAFMAWILLGGGSYMVPYATLVLACLFVNETIRAVFRFDGEESVKWWRPAATLAGMAVVSVGLGAIKLVPLLEFITGHPRPVDQKDFTNPFSAIAMLVVPREHGAWAANAGDYYVGWWILALAVIALLAADRKGAKFWAIAAFFFLFACGEFIEDAPYEYLHGLPIFSQLRFPVRMLSLVALFLALAASRGVTRIEDATRSVIERVGALVSRIAARFAPREDPAAEVPGGVSAMAVLGAVGAAALAGWLGLHATRDVVEHNGIGRGSVYIMQPPRSWSDEFRQARGNRWDAHVWPEVSRGTIHCFEENKVFTSPYLRGDLEQEEYGAPDADTKVERLSWSPHKIVLRVTSNGPGRFLVNQNHSDAWKTDVGTLYSDGGLITVRVPEGTHVVTLEYSDWRIRLGAAISFATALAIAIRLGRRARGKARALARWWRIAPVDGAG